MKVLKSRGGPTRGSGFADSVQTLWIYYMHVCAIYHKSMTSLTELHHTTSDQNEEMGLSSIKRDYDDLQKLRICIWFDTLTLTNLLTSI